MDLEVENNRPNIRIEIVNNTSNNFEGKMDVDEDNENEEGEISDDNMEDDNEIEQLSNNKISSGAFTTGINIFDKKEQEKLQERAKRFALKPDEVQSFTEQDLLDLKESLGINSTNENEVKFDRVHLLGLEKMSAEDIVEYFVKFAPEGIEWIDKNSCNIVWLDNLSAARALHFKSRVVRGMPAREPKDIFPKEFLDDVEEPDIKNGESILIKNKNREIELQNEIGEIILPKNKTYPSNSVDISEIHIPIPPGYWRLGEEHPNTKCLLVRFAKITDKLPFKSEKCNKYYKKLSNPNQRYVISESKKKELRSIFERNKELNQNKNPWGSLARNWDKDARFREREPVMHHVNDEDDDVQIVEIKNPKLQARLGTKRKRQDSADEVQLEAQEEQLEEEPSNGTRQTLSERIGTGKKKTKIPRMKMYADEEEENRKRKKILMRIKKQAEQMEKQDDEGDLRNMLGHTNRYAMRRDTMQPVQNKDLGSRLKNRSQRMVFAIERGPIDYDNYDSRLGLSDVRRELIARSHTRHIEKQHRAKPPAITRSVLIRPRMKEERLSPERRTRHSGRDRERSYRSSRRRTPERTLHSDRMHTSSRRHRSYSPNNRHSGKTRSKVAVVIKKPQKPTVASTIWSKVHKASESEQSSSDSEDESESETDESSSQESSSSTSSEESGSESEESDEESDSNSSKSSEKRIAARNPDRPGFDKSRLSHKVNHKSPLKITTTNEHFSHRRIRK